MNWLPALDALRQALSRTLDGVPSNSALYPEVERQFQLLSGDILLKFDLRLPAAVGWQTTLETLHECLQQSFDRITTNRSDAGREICERFDLLVRELRRSVRKHAADCWPVLNLAWELLSREADRITKEGQVQFGQANVQTIYFLRGEATVENLRWLMKIAKDPTPRSPTFQATLQTAIAHVRFRVHLRAFVKGSPRAKRRVCQRLCKWAEARQKDIPTLTAGRPCLLEKANAEETMAVLKKALLEGSSMKGVTYVPKTLALCFGEEAIQYLDFFIRNNPHFADQKRAFRALRMIGGQGDVTALLGLAWQPSPLHEEALKTVERLAITPAAAVALPGEEEPGRAIDETVLAVLETLKLLKQQSWTNRRLIQRVEKTVRAYHQPVDP